jgi:hypothetical protein
MARRWRAWWKSPAFALRRRSKSWPRRVPKRRSSPQSRSPSPDDFRQSGPIAMGRESASRPIPGCCATARKRALPGIPRTPAAGSFPTTPCTGGRHLRIPWHRWPTCPLGPPPQCGEAAHGYQTALYLTPHPGVWNNGSAPDCADVAELADALDSGSSARKGVEVQVLSSAPEPPVSYLPITPAPFS